MIEIEFHKGQMMVDSRKLYEAMGLHPANYSRWMRETLKLTGRNIDFFEVESLLKVNRRIKIRHYFTIEMARALSIKTLTIHSKKINAFLKMEAMKELQK